MQQTTLNSQSKTLFCIILKAWVASYPCTWNCVNGEDFKVHVIV